MQVNIILNGTKVTAEAAPDTLLIDFVRAHGCYSVKRGCETSNCGLCTVFLDDVPVLKQNLFLYNMDESWPSRWYDLQQIFLKNFPRGEGEGLTLESVVDRLGIEHDGDFHNALDDALYTTKICRRLPLAQGIAEYPDPAAQLTAALLNNTDTETYDIQTYFDRLDHDAYKNDPALYQVGCPFCGKPLVLNDIWLKRGNTGYYTEATCPDHGPWFLRFKLNRRDGLHWNFARCIETVRPL